MTKTQHWFATSCFGPDLAHALTGSTDASLTLVHAKALGTVLSACGQETTSWIKHWEPFRAVGGAWAYEACVRAVADDQRHRTSATATKRAAHRVRSRSTFRLSPSSESHRHMKVLVTWIW